MSEEKGHYTLEEILEQANAWRAVLAYITGKEESIRAFFRDPAVDIIFSGCGSSYYLGIMASSIFQTITGMSARAVPSSEIFLFDKVVFAENRKYRLVSISRSGTTTEIIIARNFAKENYDLKELVISCYPDSELAKGGDEKLIAEKSQEKSVVMTKALTSMLLLAQLSAAIVSDNKEYQKELEALPERGEEVIKNFHSLAKSLGEDGCYDKFVFLGGGPYFGAACEVMLKLKEMALVSSQAFHMLEFRHGPKSVIDDKTLVGAFLSDSGKDYEVKLLEELRRLGASTFVFCDKADEGIKEVADYLVEIDSGLSEMARVGLYLPIAQLFAYYKAISRGINPDKPKHLDQVVEL